MVLILLLTDLTVKTIRSDVTWWWGRPKWGENILQTAQIHIRCHHTRRLTEKSPIISVMFDFSRSHMDPCNVTTCAVNKAISMQSGRHIWKHAHSETWLQFFLSETWCVWGFREQQHILNVSALHGSFHFLCPLFDLPSLCFSPLQVQVFQSDGDSGGLHHNRRRGRL